MMVGAEKPKVLIVDDASENILILPRTDMEGAMHLAEKVRRAMAALNIQHARSDVAEHVSLSLGIATVSVDQKMSPLDLIEAADASLYRAKERGRNRACCQMAE
ncbi:diguanylate cyclase domain-containing protein [Thermodesulfobacteriota bacterium]